MNESSAVPERSDNEITGSYEDSVRQRLQFFSKRGVVQRVVDWLYGFDYFISYRRSDGQQYAVLLAERLKEQDFTPFLDARDYLPGDNWKAIGERCLKRTSYFVLVASPEAIRPNPPRTADQDPILREVKVFAETGKRIITINVDGSLTSPASEDSPLMQYLDSDMIWIDERVESLTGGPSEQTIEELKKAFKVTRQRVIRKRVFVVATTSFCLLVALALSLMVWANRLYVDNLVKELLSNSQEETSGPVRSIVDKMRPHKDSVVSKLKSHCQQLRTSTDLVAAGKQRADAGIACIQFGDFEAAVNCLASTYEEPETLSQFACRCRSPGGLSLQELVEFAEYSLANRQPPLVCYSALIGLGEFKNQEISNAFLQRVEGWYCKHPSAAVHSACGWLLGNARVIALNKKLAREPRHDISSQSANEWFVVQLPNPKLTSNSDDVIYLTFILFENEGSQFALSDREITVGICNELGAPADLYDYDKAEVDDPLNDVTYDDAMEFFEVFAFASFHPLIARLPDEKEWAIAWGNPSQTQQRVFNFGEDQRLLSRYAVCGPSSEGRSRPSRVATLRPSVLGMFDIQGNVAEWTTERDGDKRQFRLRGGAVGQNENLCKWNVKMKQAPHRGIRCCLTLSPSH